MPVESDRAVVGVCHDCYLGIALAERARPLSRRQPAAPDGFGFVAPDLEQRGVWAHLVDGGARLIRAPQRIAVVDVHADGDAAPARLAQDFHHGIAARVAERGRYAGDVQQVAAVQQRDDFERRQPARGAARAPIPPRNFSASQMVEQLDARLLPDHARRDDADARAQRGENHLAFRVGPKPADPRGANAIRQQPNQIQRRVRLRAGDMHRIAAVGVIGADIARAALYQRLAEGEEVDWGGGFLGHARFCPSG